MEKQLKENLLKEAPPTMHDENRINGIKSQVKASNKKLIVLDDDPTGTQTVHDVAVLTVWDRDTLRDAFEKEDIFYILTNSRSLNSKEAEVLIKEIMINIVDVAKSLHMDFTIAYRGDSTLRGHYPLESITIKSVIEESFSKKIHGEIIIPFFKEGNRYTFNDIHWIEEGDWWIPVGESEFAKDLVFGYKNSDLKEWIEEKTEGAYSANEVISISLDDIRKNGVDRICEILMKADSFQKVIVNAVEYSDLEIFILGLLKAEQLGKNFIYRTAASFVRVRSGISSRALLSTNELINTSNSNGGLIVVGSHVNKSTLQLKHAIQAENTIPFEVDVENLINSEKERENEMQRAIETASKNIMTGRNVVIYTSRKVIMTQKSHIESNLDISKSVSKALVEIVRGLSVTPKFVIAKGGITSSDIGTKALGVKKTRVLGQIRKGVPVWKLDENCTYIIFPGNVGTEYDLKDIIEQLNGSDR